MLQSPYSMLPRNHSNVAFEKKQTILLNLSQRANRRLVCCILLLHTLLAVTYSLIVPLGEGYDEWGHFAYVRYVVENGRLPASGQRLVPECEFDMTHHPPLYYLITAGATWWIDMSDNLRPWPNPHFNVPNGGENVFIHGPQEDWPYHGSALGFHVARLVSVLMGTATCLVTYLLARELLPDDNFLPIVALAIISFMPQMLFMSSIVNNDPAIALFLALFLLFLVRIITRGPSLSNWLGLTIAGVSAILTKANAVSLLPTALIALPAAFLTKKVRGFKRTWLPLAGFLALNTGVLLGWESWNTHLQGHWASTSGAIGNVLLPALLRGPRYWITSLDWSTLWSSYGYAHITFWASFGWGNIPVGEWIYWTLGAIVICALVGFLITLLHKTDRNYRAGSVALLLFCLFSLMLPSYLVLVTGHAGMFPGRYVLPIAGPLAIILAIGLSRIWPGPHGHLLPTALALGLTILSTWLPFYHLAPLYARPTPLSSVEQIPSGPLFYFADKIILHGFEGPEDGIQPGHTEEFTLYWEAIQPIEQDYSVDIQILDTQQRFQGATRTYPGQGTFPTSLWEPGRIYRDVYRIDVEPAMPTPSLAQLKVVLYDHTTGECLAVRTENGGDLGTAAIFGRLRAYSPQKADSSAATPFAIYGDSIQLIDCQLPPCIDPEGDLTIRLQWRCQQPLGQSYSVFVHLVDAQGEIIAQSDGLPRGGSYPTDIWAPGDLVVEERKLTLPTNGGTPPYYIRVGLYMLDTMQRLPASTLDGSRLAEDQYVSDALPLCAP